MSTGYGWEGLKQVCAMLLGARYISDWALLRWLRLLSGAITNVWPLPFDLYAQCWEAER